MHGNGMVADRSDGLPVDGAISEDRSKVGKLCKVRSCRTGGWRCGRFSVRISYFPGGVPMVLTRIPSVLTVLWSHQGGIRSSIQLWSG